MTPAVSRSAAIRAAFPVTIPVLTGYLCLGMAFGMLLKNAGYGLGWAAFMSVSCFAGSAQFMAITLLTGAFDPLAAFVLSLMINARHVFYGLSVLEQYRGTGRLRPFLIFGLTDETFSLVSTVEPPAGVAKKDFYFWVTLLDYSYWVTGSVVGNLLGAVLPFDTKGMDFALTALFVVLFMEQWKERKRRPAGVIGLGCTVLSLVIFGSGNLVIPAMIFILVSLLVGRTKLCD